MSSDKPARPTLLREAAILAKGKARILQSGDWLTAEALSNVTSSYLIDEWKRTGKIFAIQDEGKEYYPSYGFDPDAAYTPRVGMAEVIATLALKKTGWGIALWFGSSNSYLAGRLPKDVLKDEPSIVLEAAKYEICGVHF